MEDTSTSWIDELRNYDHSALSVAEAIGKVVFHWSYLEIAINHLIWGLSGLHQIPGRAITTHLTLPVKINIIKTLANLRYHNNELALARIGDVVNQIEKVSPRRNHVIHADWILAEDGHSLTLSMVSARGKLSIKEMEASIDEIMNVVKEINTAFVAIVQIFDEKIIGFPTPYGTDVFRNGVD